MSVSGAVTSYVCFLYKTNITCFSDTQALCWSPYFHYNVWTYWMLTRFYIGTWARGYVQLTYWCVETWQQITFHMDVMCFFGKPWYVVSLCSVRLAYVDYMFIALFLLCNRTISAHFFLGKIKLSKESLSN